MAQKTTLVPMGIPGQMYGSFAGKTPGVAVLPEIVCVDVALSLVTIATVTVSLVTTATATETECD